MTVQVESNTPGLSPREANLKITQKGRPLTLEPTVAEHTGGGTIVKQSDPEGGNPGIYLLDHGYGAAGGAYTLAMKSNTNWYWYWNTDDGQQVHEANMGLVAPNWKAKPDDRVPTTDHPDNGKSEHTWTEVATFSVPDFDRGDTAFDESQTDQEQPDVPLGGERTVVRELRNVHPELTADDMEENARQLHIRRELPAPTPIIEWPWADMTSLNWAMENNQYDDKLFRFGTNATGKLTLTTGFDLSEQAQPNSEKTYTSTQGYQLFEEKFADLTRVAVTPESEGDDPVFYKLRFTGRTANADESANEAVDEKRIYYTGTQMNVPLRNMLPAQRYLSSGAHTLKLDFSNSYFNRVKVRVKTVLVNTDGTTDGVDDYWANNPDNADPRLAKEHHLFPTTDWENGVEFTSDGSSKLIDVQLPENIHYNMMYKVVVEYARHKGNGNYEDQWQELDKLVIYQDGKPYAGNVIWKYTPQEYGWDMMAKTDQPNPVLPKTNLRVDMTNNDEWIYAAPFAENASAWGDIKGSFTNAKAKHCIRGDAKGPDGLTGKRVEIPNQWGPFLWWGFSSDRTRIRHVGNVCQGDNIFRKDVNWINPRPTTKVRVQTPAMSSGMYSNGSTWLMRRIQLYIDDTYIRDIMSVEENTWARDVTQNVLVLTSDYSQVPMAQNCWPNFEGWGAHWWGNNSPYMLGMPRVGEYGWGYHGNQGYILNVVWFNAKTQAVYMEQEITAIKYYALEGEQPTAIWRKKIELQTTNELNLQQ